MVEKTISAIGPNTTAVLPITNIAPAASGFATAEALTSQVPGANVILINTIPFTLEDGETVSFGHAEGNANCSLHANAFIISDLTATSFKIKETNQSGTSIQAVKDMALPDALAFAGADQPPFDPCRGEKMGIGSDLIEALWKVAFNQCFTGNITCRHGSLRWIDDYVATWVFSIRFAGKP